MPFPFMRRVQSTASAAPTSTFFGSHPRRAQVPPKGLESTIATCHPASRQRDTTAEAADPVPIAITSNVLVIGPHALSSPAGGFPVCFSREGWMVARAGALDRPVAEFNDGGPSTPHLGQAGRFARFERKRR